MTTGSETRHGPPGSGAAAADAAPGGEAEEELATRLRVAVTRLNRRLRQQSLAGLSPSQAAALGSINRLGSPTLGELALAEQVQPPTMTRLVAGMEREGLVVRFQDDQDRRMWRVRLSGDGRRMLQRIHRLKNAFLARRLAALDDAERERVVELTELLERIVTER
ncbi:MAG: MarR family winged helix-turn-helix transcriptional regulator [Acidimicrobiales bacterium]